jgi:hypothetical protein
VTGANGPPAESGLQAFTTLPAPAAPAAQPPATFPLLTGIAPIPGPKVAVVKKSKKQAGRERNKKKKRAERGRGKK